ncbi:MAG: 5'/3'-nucleotidase SurE [Treponema sp.]|nr:5'/3'-nucleotidase SurE [Treponema sp.]
MKLLLTNDDGFSAEGIQALAAHLKDEHEVWIVAPDKNRSAVSNGITMFEPLRIKKRGERVFSCSGMPVDCVIAALKSGLLGGMPDAVLSGINRGANMGTDILYSGTCAGARQAVLYGVPGIALSVRSHNDEWQYDALAEFARKNINSLMSLAKTANKDGSPNGECVFVNVNALSQKSYKGVKHASDLSFREYGDSVTLVEGPDGDTYCFFCGGSIISHGSDASDNAICESGCIAVSCIHAEPCSYKVVDDFSFSL